MTEQEARTAMDRIPPELHRLLLWLATGKHAPAGNVLNGTA